MDINLCVLCGSKAEIFEWMIPGGKSTFQACCNNCSLKSNLYEAPLHAIAGWNRVDKYDGEWIMKGH